MSQLKEIVVNEKISVGQLVERDGILYQCTECHWLEDSDEAIDASDINETPFLGWNSTLLERPTSAQPPLAWLWIELEKDLSADRLATLKASYNAQNQVYQKSRTADTRAKQLARTKEQKRRMIATYTAQLAGTTVPSEQKYLKRTITKAQAYLNQRGEIR